MKIAGLFSFNKGEEIVSKKYPLLRREVEEVLHLIDASQCKTKESQEKTMPGQLLYSPVELNRQFKTLFYARNWTPVRVKCEYPSCYYLNDYVPQELNRGAFREMDFVKEKLGVEVQFGKYSFMVYNVAAKMTIFRNLGYIDTGIEIVPVKSLAAQMSRGVSYFEQFVWDLEQRGVADIDVPVLIIGIDI